MAEPADPGGIDPGREALLGVLCAIAWGSY